jgi:hypothetical protein
MTTAPAPPRLELPFNGNGVLEAADAAGGPVASIDVDDRACFDMPEYVTLKCNCWTVGLTGFRRPLTGVAPGLDRGRLAGAPRRRPQLGPAARAAGGAPLLRNAARPPRLGTPLTLPAPPAIHPPSASPLPQVPYKQCNATADFCRRCTKDYPKVNGTGANRVGALSVSGT